MHTQHPMLEILSWISAVFTAILAGYLFFWPQVQGIDIKNTGKESHLSILEFKTNSITPSLSPSFNCSRASNKVERLICITPELAMLDISLSNAYRDLWSERTTKDMRKKLKSGQNYWLRNIRDNCPDLSCLESVYEARIAELQNASR